MAHVMKHTKAACGHMFKHYERAKDENGEYLKFGNQSIDESRTHLNYNLAAHQELKQGDFVRKRCGEVRCQNRKDVNVMCSWVVTKPKDVLPEEQEKFFEETYKFLEARYDKENVVSAYVHLDETTPHIHFAFVPVLEDKKRGGLKVSAKQRVNRSDLNSFHSDLSAHLERALGHEVQIENGATKNGNKNKEQLEASEKLQEVTEQLETAQGELSLINAEIAAKKAYIEECDKLSEVSVMYPAFAEKKKSLFGKVTVTVPAEQWERKHVSANEKSALKAATMKFDDKLADFRYTFSAHNVARLKRQVDELENKTFRLEYDNRNLQVENKRLSRRLERIFEVLPDEQAKELQKLLKMPRNRGKDR